MPSWLPTLNLYIAVSGAGVDAPGAGVASNTRQLFPRQVEPAHASRIHGCRPLWNMCGLTALGRRQPGLSSLPQAQQTAAPAPPPQATNRGQTVMFRLALPPPRRGAIEFPARGLRAQRRPGSSAARQPTRPVYLRKVSKAGQRAYRRAPCRARLSRTRELPLLGRRPLRRPRLPPPPPSPPPASPPLHPPPPPPPSSSSSSPLSPLSSEDDEEEEEDEDEEEDGDRRSRTTICCRSACCWASLSTRGTSV